MKRSRVLLSLLAAAGLLFVVGCAPAYRCYSGCGVNCRYCPPTPLPYPSYCDCQCHSTQAQAYLDSQLGNGEMMEADSAMMQP